MDVQEWHVVDPPTEEGDIKKIKISGKSICLILFEGEFYAVAARCPHAGADLSQGWCEDRKIVCPYHRHRFDLASGRGDQGQGNFIPVYPMKKENGETLIRIKKSWWKNLLG